jgi:hypothetical protein
VTPEARRGPLQPYVNRREPTFLRASTLKEDRAAARPTRSAPHPVHPEGYAAYARSRKPATRLASRMQERAVARNRSQMPRLLTLRSERVRPGLARDHAHVDALATGIETNMKHGLHLPRHGAGGISRSHPVPRPEICSLSRMAGRATAIRARLTHAARDRGPTSSHRPRRPGKSAFIAIPKRDLAGVPRGRPLSRDTTLSCHRAVGGACRDEGAETLDSPVAVKRRAHRGERRARGPRGRRGVARSNQQIDRT